MEEMHHRSAALICRGLAMAVAFLLSSTGVTLRAETGSAAEEEKVSPESPPVDQQLTFPGLNVEPGLIEAPVSSPDSHQESTASTAEPRQATKTEPIRERDDSPGELTPDDGVASKAAVEADNTSESNLDSQQTSTSTNLNQDDEVAQVGYQEAQSLDPHQFHVDERVNPGTRFRLLSQWNVSASYLAATRSNEDVIIDGLELGTGVNSGVRARIAERLDGPNGTLNGWEIVGMAIQGQDSNPPDPFDTYRTVGAYESFLASGEFNAVLRTEHGQRTRKQLLGVRYIEQRDLIELADFRVAGGPPTEQEAKNAMVGLQLGFEQAWNQTSRMHVCFGVKAGVFRSQVEESGLAYTADAKEGPYMLEGYADVAYQLFQGAKLGVGVYGMRLGGQHQARNAWQYPGETETINYLGMQGGFGLNF